VRLRASIVLAMIGCWIGLAGAGCRKIENPHPEIRDRDGLLLFNYRIRSGVTREVGEHQPLSSASFTSQTLRLLVPSNRIPSHVSEAFGEATGAKVSVTEYDGVLSNLEARLDGGAGWDVMLLPGVVMQRFIEDDRIMPLRHEWLPNLAGLEPFYRTNVFDPGQVHSVPYLWSTAGIAYNFGRLDYTPGSWRRFFSPPSNAIATLRGRISLLPDAPLAIAPALLYLGYSPNSTNVAELEAAGQLLRARFEELQFRWMAVPPATRLMTEEILCAECFAGDIAPVIVNEPRLLFAVPEDGTWIRIEFLTILNSASEPVAMLAHAFINFLLDSKVAGQVSTASFQGSTIPAALAFVDSAVRNGGAYARPPDPNFEKFDRTSDLRRRLVWDAITNAAPATTPDPE
jgi:spermidine/putrescine transport system substrate-binding protein